jgi:Fe-S-cluster containining protein
MYLPLYQRWISVFREGESWRCLRCGECCRRYAVELHEGEVERFQRDEVEILDNGRRRIKRRFDGFCIFYDEKKRICRIYENRPDSCRIFPFSILRKEVAEKMGINFDDRDIVEHRGKFFIIIYDEACLGIGKGEKQDRKKIVEECYNVALKFGFKF